MEMSCSKGCFVMNTRVRLNPGRGDALGSISLLQVHADFFCLPDRNAFLSHQGIVNLNLWYHLTSVKG